MPEKNSKIRSTFPIPHSRVIARKWKMALSAPVTWAPFLPVMGAFTFLDAGPMLSGLLALGVGGGVAAYWKSQHGKLEGKIIQSLVDESNDEQDEILIRNARRLYTDGHNSYAASLCSFLETKREIEKAIHSEGELTFQKQEIEKLIDAIAFGASDQLKQLAYFDEKLKDKGAIPLTEDQKEKIQKARSEISDRLHDAFETLEQTQENIGLVLNPASDLDRPDTSDDMMDSAINQLKKEQDVAQRVRKRMKTEWADQFPEDNPDIFDSESAYESE